MALYNMLRSICVGGRKCVISHNDVTIGSAFTDVTAADCSAVSISFSYLVDGRVVCYTRCFEWCGKSISLPHDMRTVLQ